MIKLDTTNGHNKKVIDDFNEVSSKIADSELLYLILTYWADDQLFMTDEGSYYIDDLIGKRVQVGTYIFTVQED